MKYSTSFHCSQMIQSKTKMTMGSSYSMHAGLDIMCITIVHPFSGSTVLFHSAKSYDFYGFYGFEEKGAMALSFFALA